MYLAAQSAPLVPRKEVSSLIPGSHSHFADVYLNWKKGQPATLDVSVISTLRSSFWLGPLPPRAMPSQWGWRASWLPTPPPVTPLGSTSSRWRWRPCEWSEEAAITIQNISCLQGQCLGIPQAESTQCLFLQLAISLWRGNATLWIRHLPVHRLLFVFQFLSDLYQWNLQLHNNKFLCVPCLKQSAHAQFHR